MRTHRFGGVTRAQLAVRVPAKCVDAVVRTMDQCVEEARGS
jgi:hypothetical protein